MTKKYGPPQNQLETRSNFLGKGTFGEVTSVKDNESIVAKTFLKNTEIEYTTFREIAALKALNGLPNIVNLVEVKTDKFAITIYLTRYKHDLHDYVKYSFDEIDENFVKEAMFQILNGLQVMANRDLYHRDIKPANILVNHDTLEFAIADWGSSRKGSIDNTGRGDIRDDLPRVLYDNKYSLEVGTISYVSPELALHNMFSGKAAYDIEVDVWSTAMILCYIVNGKPLINTFDYKDVLRSIFRIFGSGSIDKKFEDDNVGENKDGNDYWMLGLDYKEKVPVNEILKTDNEELLDLFSKMTKLNPKERITISEALNHEYFEGLEPSERSYPVLKRVETVDLRNYEEYKPILLAASKNTKAKWWNITSGWAIELLNSKVIQSQELFFISFDIFERYIRKVYLKSHEIQLAYICCLQIADIMIGDLVDIEHYLSYMKGEGREDEANQKVLDIMKLLDYNLYSSTEYDYLKALIKKDYMNDMFTKETSEILLVEGVNIMKHLITNIDTRDLTRKEIAEFALQMAVNRVSEEQNNFGYEPFSDVLNEVYKSYK